VQQVQDRVFGPGVVLIPVRRVHGHPALHANGGGIVPYRLYIASLVGFPVVFRDTTRNQQYAQITRSVALHGHVGGVIHHYPVHYEAVRVNFGVGQWDGGIPYTGSIAGHCQGGTEISRP